LSVPRQVCAELSNDDVSEGASVMVVCRG